MKSGTTSSMKKARDYTGICVVHYCYDGNGNVLMNFRLDTCRDEYNKWDIGGGGLKYGEKINDAVIRELSEEYCTKPLRVDALGHREIMRTRKNGEASHWVAFDFKVLVDPKTVSNGEPHKHREVRWFPRKFLPSPLHSQLPVFLKKYESVL